MSILTLEILHILKRLSFSVIVIITGKVKSKLHDKILQWISFQLNLWVYFFTKVYWLDGNPILSNHFKWKVTLSLFKSNLNRVGRYSCVDCLTLLIKTNIFFTIERLWPAVVNCYCISLELEKSIIQIGKRMNKVSAISSENSTKLLQFITMPLFHSSRI